MARKPTAPAQSPEFEDQSTPPASETAPETDETETDETPTPQSEPEESATIRVKATEQNGRVILCEADPAHPGGFAFIAGTSAVYEVSRTTEVDRLLANGVIAEE